MNAFNSNNDPNRPSSTETFPMMTAMFHDRDKAERVYNELISNGFSRDDINLIMSDDTRKQHFDNDRSDSDMADKAMEGAGAGSAIGGTAGAITAAIAAIGTNLVLPGVGLVIAGPLAAAFAGAGVGGLAGGLVGALIGSGIPEDTAEAYREGLEGGGIVVGAQPRSVADREFLVERGFH